MKKYNFFILVFISMVFSCSNPSEDKLSEENPFLHSVYFWLNDSLSEQDCLAFEKGLLDLAEVQSIVKYEYGKPAGTSRDVVENTYDFAWIVYFENEEGHDFYQKDPIHLAFIDSFQHMWTEVKVFDVLLNRK